MEDVLNHSTKMDPVWWWVIAFLTLSALSSLAGVAFSAECPEGAQKCKVLTLTPEEEQAIVGQNGILDIAEQGAREIFPPEDRAGPGWRDQERAEEMTADQIAILATLTFCSVGPVSAENKCDDGSKPTVMQISILRRDSGGAESILKFERDGETKLVVRPDGWLESTLDFQIDAAARRFWQAVASAYPAVCPAPNFLWPEGSRK